MRRADRARRRLPVQRLIALGHRTAVCEQLLDLSRKRPGANPSFATTSAPADDLHDHQERPRESLPEGNAPAGHPARGRRQGRVLYDLGELFTSPRGGPPRPARPTSWPRAVNRARRSWREIIAPQALFDDPGFVCPSRRPRSPPRLSAARAIRGRGAAGPRSSTAWRPSRVLGRSRARNSPPSVLGARGYRTHADRGDVLVHRRRRSGRARRINGDRRRDSRQPRTDAHAGRRARRLCARDDRPDEAPAGARLIAERLASPLTDPAKIAARLDALAFFIEAPALREELRKSLAATPDFLRALARLASIAVARAISRPCAKG